MAYDSAVPHAQKRFAERLARVELPRSNTVLLRQLTALHRFAEDVMDSVLARVEHDLLDECTGPESYARLVQQAMARLGKKTTEGEVSTGAMLQVAWQWHKTVCQRNEHITGVYAHCYMLSWSAFCKFFYLVLYENAEMYHIIATRRADQYEYCHQVNAEENVVVTDAVILHYTVNQVWNSLQQIVPSLYRYRYTSDMKTYLYALFYRYCDIMWRRQDDDLKRVLNNPLFVKFAPVDESDESSEYYTGSESEEWDEDSDEEEDSLEDDEEAEEEEETEPYEAYQNVTVPLGDGCSLRSAYFFQGQLVFFSQLKRVSFSETLRTLTDANPLILARPLTSEQSTRCREAVLQMCGETAVRDELKKFVKNAFKTTVVPLYLYHGEMERFRAQWPHANNHAFDVLSMFRPNDNVEATKMLEMTAGQLLADDARYEKEVVLLLKCCLKESLQHEMGTTAIRDTVEQCLVMEEQVSLDVIDEHIGAILQRQQSRDGTSPPVLIRLVGYYYVECGGALYRTDRYAEAVLLWLNLLVAARLIGRKHLHVKLKSCLSLFNTQ